jgi:hypothetical protein
MIRRNKVSDITDIIRSWPDTPKIYPDKWDASKGLFFILANAGGGKTVVSERIKMMLPSCKDYYVNEPDAKKVMSWDDILKTKSDCHVVKIFDSVSAIFFSVCQDIKTAFADENVGAGVEGLSPLIKSNLRHICQEFASVGKVAICTLSLADFQDKNRVYDIVKSFTNGVILADLPRLTANFRVQPNRNENIIANLDDMMPMKMKLGRAKLVEQGKIQKSSLGGFE